MKDVSDMIATMFGFILIAGLFCLIVYGCK